MRAILNATGYNSASDPLLYYRPTPLLNIVDKPILVHIIEKLVQEGITNFEIILSHFPQMIEKQLQDGQRWGVKIQYHLARDYRYPYLPIHAIAYSWQDSVVLMGQGDSLPQFSPGFLKDAADSKIIYTYPHDIWSGWALISPNILLGLPNDTTNDLLFTELSSSCKAQQVQPFLSTQTLAELKKSNIRLISHKHNPHYYPTTAHEVEPSVWISRGVSIAQNAEIVPPVFIGEDCQIREHATIGPSVVIERECIIDIQSNIENSLICRRSYVGESLEIRNSIVDRNQLINLSLDTRISIQDDFILGELNTIPFWRYPTMLLKRGFVCLLFGCLLPIYFYMFLRHHIRKDHMLSLPASEESIHWKTFDWLTFEPNPGIISNAFEDYFKRIPLLLNIIRGEVHFVGVIPRHPNDVEKLAPDWKKLYLRSKVGLITLTDLDYDNQGTSDECYASEVYYTVHMSLSYDIKLFIRWLKKKILRFFDMIAFWRPHA